MRIADLMSQWIRVAGSAFRDPRLRSETGWVVANRVLEFFVLFCLLKVLTTSLGRAGYGEFNLAETSLLLIAACTLAPVRESYLRDYYGARQRGEERSAGLTLLSWYATVTLTVAIGLAILSQKLSDQLGVSPSIGLAAGLLFAFDRWRHLALEVMNVQRKRRSWALASQAFSVLQLAAIWVAFRQFPARADVALFAYAAASALMAIITVAPLARSIFRAPKGQSGRLRKMSLTFGLPFAALLVLQWTQGFADRYMIMGLLDTQSVGVYVAAYQICGAPYALCQRIYHSLLTPIAYQRGSQENSPRLLWEADRILLSGLFLQLSVGLLTLLMLVLFGPHLVRWLTTDAFSLPSAVIAAVSVGRLAQSLAQSTQPIFAVHHKVHQLLGVRALGASCTVGLCWIMISKFGILGAAVGNALAFSIYLAILIFAPWGCWWLVRDVRRQAHSLERGGDTAISDSQPR